MKFHFLRFFRVSVVRRGKKYVYVDFVHIINVKPNYKVSKDSDKDSAKANFLLMAFFLGTSIISPLSCNRYAHSVNIISDAN